MNQSHVHEILINLLYRFLTSEWSTSIKDKARPKKIKDLSLLKFKIKN